MASSRKVQKQLTTIENRLGICREYTRLWQEYFKFFADGFEDKKLYEKDEQAFFQLINVLALNHYRFVEMAGQYLKSGDDILKVLTETVSLNGIKGMSEAQFSKLLVDWHTIYILMNKAIGKLMTQLPVEEPQGGGKQKARKAAKGSA